MKYESVKEMGCEEFRRLTGVKRETFGGRVEILKKSEKQQKARGGRPNLMTTEDRRMMTLE